MNTQASTPPAWETAGLRGFWPTVLRVIKAPTAFFEDLPREGPVWSVIGFALIASFLPEVVTTLWEVGTGVSLGYLGPAAHEGVMNDRLLAAFDYSWKTGGLWLAEALTAVPSVWVVLTLARLPRPSMRAMFRVWAYSSAPLAFAPGFYLATAVGLWSLYLFCLGVDRAGGPRPVAVFGVSMVGSLGTLILAGAILVAVRSAFGV